jgi:hypothetical protein
MEPKVPLPCPQDLANYPSSEPDKPGPCLPPFNLLKIHFNIIQHLRLDLRSGLLHSGLFIKSLYVPLFSIRDTCLAIITLLDLITRICGEECRTVMCVCVFVCVCVCVCVALVEWCCLGKAKIIGANPTPVTRCPSQIPNGLAWDWTWASNVKSLA